MTQTTHPSKEQVRVYMQRRARDGGPLPTLERIREMLGWRLVVPVKR